MMWIWCQAHGVPNSVYSKTFYMIRTQFFARKRKQSDDTLTKVPPEEKDQKDTAAKPQAKIIPPGPRETDGWAVIGTNFLRCTPAGFLDILYSVHHSDLLPAPEKSDILKQLMFLPQLTGLRSQLTELWSQYARTKTGRKVATSSSLARELKFALEQVIQSATFRWDLVYIKQQLIRSEHATPLLKEKLRSPQSDKFIFDQVCRWKDFVIVVQKEYNKFLYYDRITDPAQVWKELGRRWCVDKKDCLPQRNLDVEPAEQTTVGAGS
jgi:hypothetical protein